MAYIPQQTGVLNPNPTAPGNLQPTQYSPAYGGIPTLPAYSTDTTTTAGTDAQGQMIQNLPGYQGAVGQTMSNIQSNLQGNVAPDVAANLATQAAQYGVGSGMAMSPASTTGFLARYGLTSNALTTQGQQQLDAQMAATPMQQTSTTQNQVSNAAAQAVYNSAPNPQMAAAASMSAAQAGLKAGGTSVGMPASPSAPGAPAATAAPTAGMGYGTAGSTPGQSATPSDDMDTWLESLGLDPNGNPLLDDAEQGQDQFTPDNTTYNPLTDQSQYNYGLQGFDDFSMGDGGGD